VRTQRYDVVDNIWATEARTAYHSAVTVLIKWRLADGQVYCEFYDIPNLISSTTSVGNSTSNKDSWSTAADTPFKSRYS